MKKQFFPLKSQSKLKHRFNPRTGFTIVELLVVIVVIGILAAITLVSYSGIIQKATGASLVADLNNASTQLKMFQVDNGNFPSSISTDCGASPTTSTNLCLKISNHNHYIGYSANPQSFLLIAGNGSLNYKITDNTAPIQLANTIQPGVTPGASLELLASRANGGTSPGINSPPTTTWSDTSGNGRNGALSAGFNYTTTLGWIGSGTYADPYRLRADTVVPNGSSFIALPNPVSGVSAITVEVWAQSLSNTSPINSNTVQSRDMTPTGFMLYRSPNNNSFTWQVGNGVGDFYIPATPADGALHQIVLTAGAFGAIVYCDGQPYGTSSGFVYAPSTASPWYALDDYNSSAYTDLSIIRIYPFALTAAQVSANYSAGPN